jgi:hypothetical protein
MRRKAARLIDWFQLVTRVLFGELSFPLERFVFFSFSNWARGTNAQTTNDDP